MDELFTQSAVLAVFEAFPEVARAVETLGRAGDAGSRGGKDGLGPFGVHLSIVLDPVVEVSGSLLACNKRRRLGHKQILHRALDTLEIILEILPRELHSKTCQHGEPRAIVSTHRRNMFVGDNVLE
jgi:hypothetical protein